MVKHNLISVDLAKNAFQICGMSRQQKITFNKSIRRKELPEFMANQPPVEVAMEACYSSHSTHSLKSLGWIYFEPHRLLLARKSWRKDIGGRG